MYIEKVIINGFKSYREHTVIDGFDRYFNAITGPNGSGKSNILDAICFVLGIQNLSQVRASSLQKLIYKDGQAGVTKASVEIVFNNNDKENSPVGYEQFDRISVCRQVTSGSSSKYFINEHVANAARVQNLFQSIQLNVNNPHFLIMQGRITAVLSMKPNEILGLIEEAAGIKMYEDKKEETQRILERKQIQLDEINRIISENLEPNLEKLKKEREEYDRWASLRNEVERMQRWVVAYDYKETDQILKDGNRLSGVEKEKKRQLDEKIETIDQQIKEKQILIEETTKLKENKEKGTDYAGLEKDISKYNKQITKYETLIGQVNSDIERCHRKIKTANKQLENSEVTLLKKENELKNAKNANDEVGKKLEEAQQNVSNIETRINDVNIGIAGEGQNKKSVHDEIEEQKGLLKDSDIAINKIHANQPYLRGRKVELERSISDAINEKASLEKEVADCTRKLDEVKSKLADLETRYSPNEENRLRDELDRDIQMLSVKRDDLNNLERALGGIDFKYSCPNGLDPSKVYGTLVKFFKSKNDDYNLALQVTAGGKLYYIIVEDENVSHALIYNGRLSHRYNFIPLQKVRDPSVPQNVVQKIKRVAKGRNADIAIDLVRYDQKFEKAIRYAFGNTVICDDKETAHNIAYDREIRLKTVTREGDSYDPQGIVSGGYRANSRNEDTVIYKLARLAEGQMELEGLQDDITSKNSRLNAMKNDSELYKSLIDELELAEHQRNSAVNRQMNSAYHESATQLDEVNKEIEDNEVEMNSRLQRKKVANQRIAELTKEIEEWNMKKGEKLSALEKELKNAKKMLDEMKSKKNNQESIVEQLELDYQSMTTEKENIEKEIKEIEKSIEESNENKSKYQEVFDSNTKKLKTKQEAFETLKKEILETKDALSKYVSEENELQKEATNLKIELNQCENNIAHYEQSREAARIKLKQMKKDFQWIEQEERFFGVPHTDFDFKQFKPKEARQKLDDLQSQQEELSARVNKKVISMYDKAENELSMLKAKRETVESEKKGILEIVQQLDIKKQEAIMSTHVKVNNDLTEIVQMIIPGITARLIAPEGLTIYEGLELTVSFNNLQKSLRELSGGQRSLIALGLVLALLKFKPAPVYILDEIDAALDLNYTQNIGKMLRKSFQTAQFIIVSLKEGMFNNANVVYRTSFRDSNSSVKRTENAH